MYTEFLLQLGDIPVYNIFKDKLSRKVFFNSDDSLNIVLMYYTKEI